jgi:hypothetical protein
VRRIPPFFPSDVRIPDATPDWASSAVHTERLCGFHVATLAERLRRATEPLAEGTEARDVSDDLYNALVRYAEALTRAREATRMTRPGVDLAGLEPEGT